MNFAQKQKINNKSNKIRDVKSNDTIVKHTEVSKERDCERSPPKSNRNVIKIYGKVFAGGRIKASKVCVTTAMLDNVMLYS